MFVPIAFVDRFQILWSNVVLYANTAEMSNRKMVDWFNWGEPDQAHCEEVT